MIICLCNTLRETDVEKACNQGASTIASVFKTLGCQPNCGKCFCMMKENFLEPRATGGAGGFAQA